MTPDFKPHAARILPRLTILFPLVMGLAVRLVGLRHGEPDMIYHPDMAKQVLVARATYAGNADPCVVYGKEDVRRCLYPYGTAVITGRLGRLYTAVTRKDLDKAHRFYWALRMRYVAVAFSLLSAAAVMLFLFGRWGPVAALAAGTLLCLEPVNAQFSHYGMNDVPMVALLLLSWIAAGMMHKEKTCFPICSFLSGLFAGIAFGIKYQGIFGFIFAGIAGLDLLKCKGWKWAVPAAVSVAAGFACGALLTCPLLLSNPLHFFEAFPRFMSWQADILERHIPLSEKLPRNTAAVACLLWSNGHWLLFAGAPVAAVLLIRRSRRTEDYIPVLSALVFCGLFMLTVIGARDIIRANDLLPLLDFLVLPGGFVLALAAHPWREKPSLSRYACTGAAAMLALIFFTVSLQDALALARPDTQLRAREWCRANIPLQSTVLRERYTVSVGRSDIEEHAVRFLCDEDVRSRVESIPADFVIASSLAYGRFFDRLSPYFDKECREHYSSLTNRYEAVAVFEDRPLFYNQPSITVYRRKPGK